MPNFNPYTTAVEDLAKIIACETSGVADSLPEQDDFDLAHLFVAMINNDYYNRDDEVRKFRTYRRSE